MTTRKRVQITFESESFWVVRATGPVARGWCPTCAAETEMVSLEEAGALFGDDAQPRVLDWLGTKQLHATEAADGSLLICLRSLRTAAP